jgi:adenosylcobinamide kinase / adenosylcobinamide-phosphate guanylyltransferase
LLFGQSNIAVVLRFHQLNGVRNVGLTLGRPSKDPIEDFLNLLFCHTCNYSRWGAHDHGGRRLSRNGLVTGSLTLVLGGARSGKSRYAERLITALPQPWTYVATAEAGDEEMAARIKAHRERRDACWRTIEAPRDLASVLAAGATTPVLVDCLTLWLANLMLADADIEAEIGRLEQALAALKGPVVLVTNEVGSGIVPEHQLGRRFRDWQGILNQRIAARADRVVLMVAGLPLALKDTLEKTP